MVFKKVVILILVVLLLLSFSGIILADKSLVYSQKYLNEQKIILNQTEYDIHIDASSGANIGLFYEGNLSILAKIDDCLIFYEEEYCFVYDSNTSVIIEKYNLSPIITFSIENNTKIFAGESKEITIIINNSGGMDAFINLEHILPDSSSVKNLVGCTRKGNTIHWRGDLRFDESKICSYIFEGTQIAKINPITSLYYDLFGDVHNLSNSDFYFMVSPPFNYTINVSENLTLGQEFELFINFSIAHNDYNISLNELRILNMNGLERLDSTVEYELLKSKRLEFNKSLNHTARFRLTQKIDEIAVKISYKIDSYLSFIHIIPLNISEPEVSFSFDAKDVFIAGKENYLEIYYIVPDSNLNYTSASIVPFSEGIEFLNKDLRVKKNNALRIPFVSFSEERHTLFFNITYYDQYNNEYKKIITKNIDIKSPGEMIISQYINFNHENNHSVLNVFLENKVGDFVDDIIIFSEVGGQIYNSTLNLSDDEKKEALKVIIENDLLSSISEIKTTFLYPFGLLFKNKTDILVIDSKAIIPADNIVNPQEPEYLEETEEIEEKEVGSKVKMSEIIIYIVFGFFILLIAGLIIYYFGLRDFLKKRREKNKKTLNPDEIENRLNMIGKSDSNRESSINSNISNSSNSSNSSNLSNSSNISNISTLNSNKETSNNYIDLKKNEPKNIVNTVIREKPRQIILGAEEIHAKLDELEKQINICIEKSDDDPSFLKIAEQKGIQYRSLKKKLDSLQL